MNRPQKLGLPTKNVLHLQGPPKSFVVHPYDVRFAKWVIPAWQKNPHAWYKHKANSVHWMREQKLGFLYNEPHGYEPTFRDPALLSHAALVRQVYDAAEQGLEGDKYWRQVIKRIVKDRDVLPVADLVILVDVLARVSKRDTFLMKVLSREFIDDAHKMTFADIAVVLNAYAFFSCHSDTLLEALGARTLELMGEDGLSNDPAHYVPLGLMVSSWAKFGTVTEHPLVELAARSTLRMVKDLPLSELQRILLGLSKMRVPLAQERLTAVAEGLSGKVEGESLQTLSSLMRGLSLYGAASPEIRKILSAQIAKQIGERAADAAAAVQSVGSEAAPFPVGDDAPAALVHGIREVELAPETQPILEEEDELEEVEGDVAIVEDDDDIFEDPEEQRKAGDSNVGEMIRAAERSVLKPVQHIRWDPDLVYDRNQLATSTATALSGLSLAWRTELAGGKRGETDEEFKAAVARLKDVSLQKEESDLLAAACSVLETGAPGLTPKMLRYAVEALCAGKLGKQSAGEGSAGLADRSGPALDAVLVEACRKFFQMQDTDKERIMMLLSEASHSNKRFEAVFGLWSKTKDQPVETGA